MQRAESEGGRARLVETLSKVSPAVSGRESSEPPVVESSILGIDRLIPSPGHYRGLASKQ